LVSITSPSFVLMLSVATTLFNPLSKESSELAAGGYHTMTGHKWTEWILAERVADSAWGRVELLGDVTICRDRTRRYLVESE
jgi:hypothetical protein